jgi:TRAP-type C4-dicarboxylate transport system permease large subunit
MIGSAIFAFGVLVAIVVLTSTVIKIPAPFGLVISAVAAGLAAGIGLPLTKIVEGSFGFLDIVLAFGCGLILVEVMSRIGFNEIITKFILDRLMHHRVLLFLSLMVLMMIPGMLTGIGSIAVVSTGPVVASVLSRLKVPRQWVAVFVMTGAILGMVAPPVNLPLMYMGVLIALPYEGFTWILLLLTIPLAAFFALWIGLRYSGRDTLGEAAIEPSAGDQKITSSIGNNTMMVLLPIMTVIVLLVLERLIPAWPELSLPLILLAGALTGIPILGVRKFFDTATEALKGRAFIILMIILTAGVKGEFLSLSGVRGLLATFFFGVVPAWLFLPSLVSLPLLGAFGTVFGATFILGYPFILALLPRNSIICAAALSLIASVADIMPPTALSGNLAANLVGEEKYRRIFVRALFPALSMIAVALLAILLAEPLASIFT